MIKAILSKFHPAAVLQMLLGTCLTAASFGQFIIPLGFSAGGITGTAKLLVRVLPFSLPGVVFVLNMLLLVLGLVCVGSRFAAKTVGVSILFPVMLELFSGRGQTHCAGLEPIAGILMAGLLLGAGSGLILRSGSSAGGYDILAVVLHRKFRIPVSMVLACCDCAVILTQAATLSLSCLLSGIAVILISSACVHILLNRKGSIRQMKKVEVAEHL